MCKGSVVSENHSQNNELICKVLDSLKTKVSSFNYHNWFQSSLWFVESANRVKIQVPNKFVRDWIIENYLEVIKFELFKLTNIEHEVIFHVEKIEKAAVIAAEPAPTEKPRTEDYANLLRKTQAPAKNTFGLNPRYTFENFVIGNSNQFVNAACRAVATSPAKKYNPLFIYGGVGLGKTHLLHAIGLEALEANPNQKIVFVSGEQFTNEVINSIRYDKTYDLRKKYRECDLLLIDDIQFIAGKERTMEEFFHTFNALYESRKQIILTSDTLPKDIPNLEERLRSRFGWGLLADIQAPDFETRCAILRKKAEAERISLNDEVCQYIATRIKTNVRDLEGSLVRVSAFASLAGVPITTTLANEVLKNILSGFTSNLTIESIQETVADYFKLRVSDLKSPRRHKNLAVPRQIAMYLCKKHVKASYPEIGQKFGGKDHTTVIHAFHKITQCVTEDSSIRDPIDQLERILAQ